MSSIYVNGCIKTALGLTKSLPALSLVQWWLVLLQKRYLSFWQLVQFQFVESPVEPVKS